MRCCAAEMAPHRNPPLPPRIQQPKTAGANSKLDKTWGQGQAHTPGNPEGLATFFVALSRAKQRAIFSFCQERGQRRRVAELFQLLTDAGVPETAI